VLAEKSRLTYLVGAFFNTVLRPSILLRFKTTLYGLSVLLAGLLFNQASKAATVVKVGIVDATVTVQAAVLLPSWVVTVMSAVPAATAVTTPFADTVATGLLLLFHVTFWFVALKGIIEATRVSVAPSLRLVVDLLRVTPVTGMRLTVTLQVAVLSPSTVLTVIVAEPAPTPVTKPPLDTVATPGLLLFHDTF
jgi:hypothetical protein